MTTELPIIANRCRVSVLQHPKEARHHLNTVPLLAGLERFEVHIWDPSENGRCPFEIDDRSVLLYPGPAARPLGEVSASEAPRQVVVIDGTWHQAKKMLRAHPSLSQLPRCVVPVEDAAPYRIRREPHPEGVSTSEAVRCALSILEPGLEGLEALKAAFEAKIDRQLGFRGNPRRKLRKRPG